MSISDRFDPNLFAGKILPTKMVRDHIFRLLLDEIAMAAQNEYRTPGVFDSAVSIAAGTGNDKVTIGSAARRIVDGIGNTIMVPAGDSRLTNVPFSNESGEDYFFGLQVGFYPAAVGSEALIEQDVYLQNRYRYFKKTIGRTAHPESVTLNGNGTLTFSIDNMHRDAASDSYKGRSARVWLVNPATSDAAVAVQTLTVESGNVCSTADGAAEAFGQTTPSTSVYDYLVCLEGPEVWRNTGAIAEQALTGTFSVTQAVDETWSMTGVGTAFTTELRAGDWIRTATGVPLLVLYVASNTSARLLSGPPGGLAAGQTGVTAAGIFYVGSVTGNGPTATPTGFSTTGQKVIEFRFSDLADVLRRDAHGYTKVRVKADASDSDEKQVEVQDASGNTVFAVDEDGDVFGRPLGASNTLGPRVFMPRDGALHPATTKAAGFVSEAEGYTGDNAATLLAAYLAMLGSLNGSAQKIGFLVDDDSWAYAFASMKNNAGLIAQMKSNPLNGLVTLLKLNASDVAEVFTDVPAQHISAGTAAWVWMHAWGTGASDQERLYVSKAAATDLQSCRVLNAQWNQASTALTDSGWSCIDTAKMAWREVWGTDRKWKIQVHAASGSTWADSGWSTVAEIDEAAGVFDVKLNELHADQFSPSLSTLPFKAFSSVADANGAVSHVTQSDAAMTLGVSRWQTWQETGQPPYAWLNHAGALDQLGVWVVEDFLFDDIAKHPMWSVDKHASSPAATMGKDGLDNNDTGGWMRLETAATAGTWSLVRAQAFCWKASKAPAVRAIIEPEFSAIGDLEIEVGLFADDTFGGDGIYVRFLNSESGFYRLIAKSTTQSADASATAPATNTGVTFEIKIEGTSSVRLFINESSTPAASVTTNIPTGNLKIAARVRAVNNAAVKLYLDKLSAAQNR